MMLAYSSNMLERMLRGYCAEAGSELQPVCLYALTGGRRARASLLLRASERCDAVAMQAACALEMMHAATLLQDDIFDCSAQRRGQRTAHVEFGKAQALLASDWLLLRSLELAAAVSSSFFQQLACAARVMAATVARELAPPALSGFLAACSYVAEICQGKTAALFAVSLHAAALLNLRVAAHSEQSWAAVGNRIGCTYQLLDDCLDMYAPAQALDKPTGCDLEQGRLTVPILIGLESLEENLSIERFMRRALTPVETEQLRCAATSNTTKAELRSRVEDGLRSIEESAWLTSTPSEAIAPVLADLQAKFVLCFGESGAKGGQISDCPTMAGCAA